MSPRPRKRRTYTDAEKARVLSGIVDDGLSLRDAADLVGVSPGTASRWAKAAGIDLGALARQKDPANATEAAREARAAARAADRAELIDLLGADGGITLRAARLLVGKLTAAEEDARLVALARQRWADALEAEALAEQFGQGAVQNARMATAKARVGVMVAEATVPDANDLSLILSRAARDLLALEGYAVANPDTGDGGKVTVLFTGAPPEVALATAIVQLEPEEAR